MEEYSVPTIGIANTDVIFYVDLFNFITLSIFWFQ